MTIVLAIPTLHDGWLRHLWPGSIPAMHPAGTAEQVVIWVLAAAVAVMSVPPVLNMLSRRQLMNFSYNPLHLVGTYGAFGGVTHERFEIVVEGTRAPSPFASEWKEYEFKGKPGSPIRRPPQVAPYHLRLDWLMWFAAMQPDRVPLWFTRFAHQLLEGDRGVTGLLKTNPFPGAPPRYVRALLYEYRFTTPAERHTTGRWWNRTLVGTYLRPTALRAGSLDEVRR